MQDMEKFSEVAKNRDTLQCMLLIEKLNAAGRINTYNDDNLSPLMLTCIFGLIEVAERLLDLGVEINHTGTSSYIKVTALELACVHNNLDVAELLFDRGALVINEENNHTAIMSLVSLKNAYLLRKFLDRGALIDMQDFEGYTALIMASYMGFTEGVKILLEYGADHQRRDNDGLTALDHAVKYGFAEIEEILLLARQ